jgi:eukaryotic-like serine/threonine-protein kinase
MTVDLPPVPNFGTAPTVTTLQFDLLSQIGRGEGLNSEVYLAHDRQLETQLAVKRILKNRLPPTYFNEARQLYYARHRHVVEIKYACQDDEHVYFAMPYYRGGTLQRLLEARYLSTREIVRYGIEFLSGLHHVHVRGLIHFDVKPTNVLLDDSDTATLADFGLCREMNSKGEVLMWNGYRSHAPPEFTPASRKVSRAADIYQAGVTLYRMCAGHSEFERQVLAHNVEEDEERTSITNGAFPERQRFLPHIPNRLRRIICRALEIHPPQRYETVLDLMNALALVDESLDWFYQQGADWGEGVWSESRQAATRRVLLSRNGAVWDVYTCWAFPTGRERRFSRFSSQGVAESAARRLVHEALTQTWH